MRVTKYPQSCLKLEKDGRAVMIDIGSFAIAKFGLADFGRFEALLATHQHADHIDEQFASTLKDIPIFANADVAQKFPQLPITAIKDGQEFEAAGFKVKAVDIPHCLMPDGSAGPPNTGFIIDDVLFHPGDGIEPQQFKVDALAAPIAGPSVSLLDAVKLARSVGAKKVIPIHYDNPVFFNDPQVLKDRFAEAEVIVLDNGQSAEL